MHDDNSFTDILRNHWIVEIAAVLLFLIFYEILIKRTFEFLSNKWKSRSYRITGKYVAYYQDFLKGAEVRTYSYLEIVQKGSRIIGSNSATDLSSGNKRIWHLEGEIFHGHLMAAFIKRSDTEIAEV